MTDRTVCDIHGGKAPQTKRKAAVRAQEREIADRLGKLQVEPVADVLTALSQVAGEILAWKELAAEKVAELKSLDTVNFATGGEEVRASILVFERALDRAVHVLATIAKLKIDERLAAISAEQGRAIADAIRTVLGDPELRLSAEQRSAAPQVLRRHLHIA